MTPLQKSDLTESAAQERSKRHWKDSQNRIVRCDFDISWTHNYDYGMKWMDSSSSHFPQVEPGGSQCSVSFDNTPGSITHDIPVFRVRGSATFKRGLKSEVQNELTTSSLLEGDGDEIEAERGTEEDILSPIPTSHTFRL